MRLLGALAALAAVGLTGAAGAAQLPPAAPAGQLVFYGHIKSLTPRGDRYVLLLDPALLLQGLSQHDAAAEDLPAGVPLVDGFYARDESHALLAFLVPRSARASVITTGPQRRVRSTRVTVGELALLLKGKNPNARALLASPAAFGYWIRVAADQVRSLDAQYRP